MPFPQSQTSSQSGSPALDRRIERLREVAAADPRLDGVLLYGSWTVGEADAYSDIEAYLYVREECVETFDAPEFISRVAPLKLVYTNMYGIHAVVFDDLMRGEFHVEPTEKGLAEVPTWRNLVHLPKPEAAVLLDRDGRLTEAASTLVEPLAPEPAATARQLADELANWTLMLAHVLTRGEIARGHALMGTVIAPQQLQLCRLLRGSTAHWLTPSRALEADLPEADRARYVACTSRAVADEVRAAARNGWRWSRDLIDVAARRWGFPQATGLYEEIAAALPGD